MISYFELLDNIEKRPSMYIGEPNLTYLSHFLSGVQIALPPEERIPKNWENFHVWVRTKLFGDLDGHSWHTSILAKCEGNHEKALQLFFDLMRAYRAEMELKYPVG